MVTQGLLSSDSNVVTIASSNPSCNVLGGATLKFQLRCTLTTTCLQSQGGFNFSAIQEGCGVDVVDEPSVSAGAAAAAVSAGLLASALLLLADGAM